MNNIKKIVLAKQERFEFKSKGLLVFGDVDKAKNSFRFRTTVFSEVSFIPYSIRKCIHNLSRASIGKKIPAILVINEELNSVELVQEFPEGVSISIIKLLKLFTFVARSWAPILKKIAKQDLMEC